MNVSIKKRVMKVDVSKTKDMESGLLSLGTGSVSWWESNGWGCVPVWTEAEGAGSWRPARVDGCLLPWAQVELAQSVLGTVVSCMIVPLAVIVTHQATKRRKSLEKESSSRRPVYKIGLNSTEAIISDNTLKPMTPRRVKRRSGSRGTSSSVRRSRRSYRNAAYLTSSASLPRDSRLSRPTSAHSSYSNFHAARPASYHAPEPSVRPDVSFDPPPPESMPAMAMGYDTGLHGHDAAGFDVVGPYNEPSRRYEPPRHNDVNMHSYDRRSNYEGAISCYMRAETMETPCESPIYRGAEVGWEAPLPPPPAPPYSSRATPQAPGPPAYQPTADIYNIT
ncbi:hypothetical protein EVAR_42082_1 [Eumeta japonica]|uniref:Sodium/potassium-transporting ATPase subunit beta-1-interacting protein n=1 Tax=Eumeta variegata TaxID=151549 RepID=A0A4C1XFY5_EUMVA|nr:hypothetical protein EVAR_42082_1 [Eumeta japonica]